MPQVRKPVKNWITHNRNNLFPLLAFALPALVRSIPMVLSWPYPIGFDTIRYISTIQQKQVFSLGLIGFFKGSNLFNAVAALPYVIFNDPVAIINVLGPLLLGALCFTVYFYARKSLGWSDWKSLFVSLLISIFCFITRFLGPLQANSRNHFFSRGTYYVEILQFPATVLRGIGFHGSYSFKP